MSKAEKGIRHFAHVVGFDDGAFGPEPGSPVLLVGAVYSALRLEGVISSQIQKDGSDATDGVIQALEHCRQRAHIQLLLFQGIAFGGFNVLDLKGLYEKTGLPVLVVTRRAPRMDAIKKALLENVVGGTEKWRLIEAAGHMQPVGPLFAQWQGMHEVEVAAVIERFTLEGHLPEPLRVAHMIASGISLGRSSRGP